MTVKKYFIAIIIPNPLYAQIEAVKRSLEQDHGLKGALRSPAHITLHRPFEWKEEKEEELLQKLSGFKFAQPLSIGLKNFACFEPRVIYVDVLHNETLYQLHDELSLFAKKELRLFNETGDLRGFHPHVTVAFRDLKKPLFYELMPQFETKVLEGSFDVKGFSVLKLEKKWEELRFLNLS